MSRCGGHLRFPWVSGSVNNLHWVEQRWLVVGATKVPLGQCRADSKCGGRRCTPGGSVLPVQVYSVQV